jgi:hypothetical protein
MTDGPAWPCGSRGAGGGVRAAGSSQTTSISCEGSSRERTLRSNSIEPPRRIESMRSRSMRSCRLGGERLEGHREMGQDLEDAVGKLAKVNVAGSEE